MAQHNNSHLHANSTESDRASTAATSGFLGLGLAGHTDVFGGLHFADFLRAHAEADEVYFATLKELNNSEAEGGALLLRDGDHLTVITAASGVEAGQVHPQHIHGFQDGRNATVPTLAQDDDRDGFIELAEGLESYGPVLLDLTSPPGAGLSGFPTPSGGSFLFAQTYDLSDPANGTLATLLDEAPLENREIVLHGLSTLEGHGEGTQGEVDGSAGYKAVLPIASGEIQKASSTEAGVAAFVDTLDGFESNHEHAVAEGTDDAGHTETAGSTNSDGEATPSETSVFGSLTFAGFLRAFNSADDYYFADLNELNNSDAEGGALLLRNGDQLTVITAASGVEPGQTHVQHIHGFEDGRESNVPTLAQDDDRDGFIELAEGLETYGPVLLNLTSSPEAGLAGFPTPAGDSFLFAQTYDLSDPANGALATLLDEAPLENREIVLHGMTTLEGHGEGTPGEVNGEGGYKLVLPIAAGEIQKGSADEVLVAFADTLDPFGSTSQAQTQDLLLA